MEPRDALRAHIQQNYQRAGDFATLLGVNPVTLRRYLSGTRKPDQRIRKEIYRLTGIDMNRLPNTRVVPLDNPSEPAATGHRDHRH